MSLNVTQTISSPLVSRTLSQKTLNSSTQPLSESHCWSICRDRFKYVVVWIGISQYFLLILYSIMVNFSYLHPVTCFKEMFSLAYLALISLIGFHEFFKLKARLEEKVYHPTKASKFIKSFKSESTIFLFNFFIGLFTSLLFLNRLTEDFTSFAIKTEEKQLLNEKFIYILFNGAFIRCYFNLKRLNTDKSFTFPIIYQSKFLQLRRLLVTVLKSSFAKTLFPSIHYFGFHIIFSGSYCYLLRRLFALNDMSVLEGLATVVDLRLFAFSWILASLIWSYMEIINSITNIYATEPMQFPIEGTNILTLSEALALSKVQITQQLAAQDLFALADHPNNYRRNQFYALSNPGGHPHNWKSLVQKSLAIVNNLTEDLKKIIDSASKNRNINNNIGLHQPIYQFYENKRLVREHNEFSGIRSLAFSPLQVEPVTVDKKSSIIKAVKLKLLSNKFIFYFFGENDSAKLNFIINQNAQIVIWITQGISAIIARSIKEDKYGIIQQDIKQVLKSLLKLKTILDKVGTVTVVAKDRELIALKSAVRRSLYRITSEFSGYFDDLMLDAEDIQSLHPFVTYKEL